MTKLIDEIRKNSLLAKKKSLAGSTPRPLLKGGPLILELIHLGFVLGVSLDRAS